MNELLQGVTVLDFSEYIAGPYCGMLLADVGARVIKIEPPDGAEERRLGAPARYHGDTRMSLAFNRGKEGVSIDLREPSGRAIVHRMIDRVDVVLQNFVPGAAERLGIDYETLSKLNPRLIFVSSTAFGDVGPYRKRKGFDIIAHAASGVMSHYADEDGAPRGPGAIPYIDFGTGMLNAFGIAAALLHRERTGKGQKIETSLFSTGLALQAMSMIRIEALDARQHEYEVRALREPHAKTHTKLIDEFAEMRLREDQPDTLRPVETPDCLHRPSDRQVFPYYRVYATANGFISVAALNRSLRERFCRALGMSDPYVEKNAGEITDEIYHSQKALMRLMEARLRERPTREWLEQLEAAGVPCAQVAYRSDLYTDPQAQALDLIWTLHNSGLGEYKASGHPIRFTKTPAAPTRGAPTLGEHTERVLTEFGFGAAELERLREQRVIR